MSVSAEMVKQLREKTGCGFMECKEALTESKGDMETAIEYLRKKGLASAAKKSSRATSEGIISSYIHAGGKIGVLLEVNCETDFVARTTEFQDFCKDVAMQVAATNPTYVSKDQVPADVIAKEKEIFKAQLADSNKPAQIIDKIIEGKIDKAFYAQACLLEQTFVKDNTKTIKGLLSEKIGKLGENMQIRRFCRFQLGN